MSPSNATIRAFMQILARVALVGLAAAAIAGAALLCLGPPALAREYHIKSEISRFTPTVGHGLIQLGGETFLLILVAYSARRWLRVRL
jgi:hypothetical protein